MPLKRELAALAERTFDLAIVGGGVIGLAAAADAARRGLSVALIERKDFGGETSAACFKIVHGGLRYLQHLDISRLYESVREQRLLRLIAPHLVHPLPFLVPCYGRGMKSPELLRVALTVYETLAGGRNKGVDDYHRLPAHRVLTPAQCLSAAPGIREEQLRGGVVFFDCQMASCERLSLAFALTAAANGAVLANYAEATSFALEGNDSSARRITKVRVRDTLDGATFELRCRFVLNATGPWAPLTAALVGEGEKAAHPRHVYSAGIQLVLPEFIRGFGVAVESTERAGDTVMARGARSYFITPWRGYSLVGTTDVPHLGPPSAFSFSREEVTDFITELRRAYRSDVLRSENVRYVFGGVRPVDEDDFWQGAGDYAGGRVTVSRRDRVIDHAKVRARAPISNLISVSGIKYTTARGVAERLVTTIAGRLEHRATGSSAEKPLVGGEVGDYTQFLRRLAHRLSDRFTDRVVRHLASHYGSQTDELLTLVEREPRLGQVLGDEETLLAEAVWAVRNEMALTLSDVVFRRTGLCTAGSPGEESLRIVAERVAEESGWSSARVEEELAQVRARLGLPV